MEAYESWIENTYLTITWTFIISLESILLCAIEKGKLWSRKGCRAEKL